MMKYIELYGLNIILELEKIYLIIYMVVLVKEYMKHVIMMVIGMHILINMARKEDPAKYPTDTDFRIIMYV